MNLWSEFAESCSDRPSKAAFLGRFGSRSFGEVYARAVSYGAAMASRPVRAGDRVLVLCTNHPETASAVLACWMNSLIPALVGPEEPASRIDYIVDLIAPSLALGSSDALDKSASSFERLATLAWEEVRTGSSSAPSSRALPTEPASIVFTSASTGRPKGVVQSHGSLIRACHAVGQYLGYRDDDLLLGAIPWTFDYGYGHLLSTLLLGITQIVPEETGPIGTANAIQKYRPTILPLIPSLASCLCRGLVTFTDIDVGSIRLITNTGGRISGSILEEMFSVFPQEDTEIVLNYGLTESYRTSYLDPALTRTHSDSIGRGIPGVQVVVVRDDGSLCDRDEIGEIVHRGDFLFMGYWGDSGATESVLRPDRLLNDGLPQRPAVLHTGDLGRIAANGLLYHHGRKDSLLKSMGVRVSPGEVEDILYAFHTVREAAVVGVDDEMLGTKVCAAVAVNTGGALADLRRQSARQMTKYMLPRAWLELPELPKTQNGKVDYRRVKALFESAPEKDHESRGVAS